MDQTGSKKKVIVLSSVLAVALVTVLVLALQPTSSADEERSRQQAIVSGFTEDTGFMEAEDNPISESDAAAIDQAADSMTSSISGVGDLEQPEGQDPGSTAEPGGESAPTEAPGQVEQPVSQEEHVQVNVRDWKQYRSSYSYGQMTSAEQSLYIRLEAAAEEYMNSGAMDAIYSSSQDLWTTYAIQYGDLELSKDTAVQMVTWFISTNPQYWYLKPSVLSTSRVLYIGIHDIGADGDDRARITNEMYQTVDSWASQVASQPTAYQKVKAAHDLVIREIGYQSGAYDQSVYSVFQERRSVCSGYAGAMSMLLNPAGVETLVVSSSSHAWNAVRMDDGSWYGLDATWDDSLGSSQFMLVSGSVLVSLDNSKEAHVCETEQARRWSPALSSVSYSASSYDSTGSYLPAALDAPSNVAVAYVDATTGRASWDSVSGADQYEVQVYRKNVLCGTTKVSSLSLQLNGLGEDTLVFKVRSLRSGSAGMEYSDWSSTEYAPGMQSVSGGTQASSGPTAESAGESVQAPDQPDNLHVVETSQSHVKIGWDAVDGADQYDVAAYSDANFTRQLASGRVSAQTMRLNNMSAGQTVYVQVRAVKTVDGVDYLSGWASLAASSDLPVKADLDVPGNLMFAEAGGTSYRATWGAVPDAASYDIEVYKDAAYSSKLTGGSVTGTSLKLNNIKSGYAYYVRVRAKAADGRTSGWAEGVLGTEAPVMGVPGSLKAAASGSSCRVSWDSVADASSYKVEVSYQSDFSSIAVSGTVKGTSLKLNNIKSGYTYYIRVRAEGTVGGTALQSEWASTSYKK